jgi:hypothetical protein
LVDVKTEILIERPPAEVASFASDPANATEWYENIESAEQLTPAPATTGSRIRFMARFLSRELAYVYEITELESGRRLVMRTADGPFEMETTYEWQPIGADATRMTLRNRGNPRGFSKLVSPFMAAAMRRANNKDLRRLKAILER